MLAEVALGAGVAFCLAVLTTPVGVSGAVFSSRSRSASRRTTHPRGLSGSWQAAADTCLVPGGRNGRRHLRDRWWLDTRADPGRARLHGFRGRPGCPCRDLPGLFRGGRDLRAAEHGTGGDVAPDWALGIGMGVGGMTGAYLGALSRPACRRSCFGADSDCWRWCSACTTRCKHSPERASRWRYGSPGHTGCDGRAASPCSRQSLALGPLHPAGADRHRLDCALDDLRTPQEWAVPEDQRRPELGARGSRPAAARARLRSLPAPAPRPGVRPATRGSLR